MGKQKNPWEEYSSPKNPWEEFDEIAKKKRLASASSENESPSQEQGASSVSVGVEPPTAQGDTTAEQGRYVINGREVSRDGLASFMKENRDKVANGLVNIEIENDDEAQSALMSLINSGYSKPEITYKPNIPTSVPPVEFEEEGETAKRDGNYLPLSVPSKVEKDGKTIARDFAGSGIAIPTERKKVTKNKTTLAQDLGITEEELLNVSQEDFQYVEKQEDSYNSLIPTPDILKKIKPQKSKYEFLQEYDIPKLEQEIKNTESYVGDIKKSYDEKTKEVNDFLSEYGLSLNSQLEDFQRVISENPIVSDAILDYDKSVSEFRGELVRSANHGEIVQKELTSRLAKIGNWGGATYNEFLYGIGSMSAGAAGLTIDLMVELMPQEMYPNMTKDEAKKKVKADLLPYIRKGTKEVLGTESTTDEYISSMQEKNILFRGITGLARSAPAMASPKMIGIFLQVSDGIEKEMSENPELKNISENEKLILKGAVGTTTMLLERFGFRNAVKGRSITADIMRKASSNIVSKTISELPKGFTKEALDKAIKRNVLDYVRRVASMSTNAFFAEAETGLSQSITENTIKGVYNSLKDLDDGFNIPKTVDAWVSQSIDDAVAEGIGGLVIGTASGVLRSNISKDEFIAIEETLLDNKLTENLISTITNAHKNGSISEEYASDFIASINRAKSILSETPQDLSDSQRARAFSLLNQRKNLEESKVGKDKSLTAKTDEKIKKIDEKLKQISNEKVQQEDQELREQEGEVKKEEERIRQEEQARVLEEFDAVEDNETVTITSKTLEKIPEQFRDRAEKVEGVEVETKKTFLGIPYGKAESIIVGDGYRYNATGEEIRNAINQEEQTIVADEKASIKEPVLEKPQDGGVQKEGEQESPQLRTEKEEVTEDAKETPKSNIGYRSGDLNTKAETRGKFASLGRGTGHFGTGFYFFSEKEVADNYDERETTSVDFSDYNLAKGSLGLHEELKIVNNSEGNVRGFNVEAIAREAGVNLEPKKENPYRPIRSDRQLKERLSNGETEAEIREEDRLFHEFYDNNPSQSEQIADRVNESFEKRENEDSKSTLIMKELGFEGVDSRGVEGLDNSQYGSVIYDIKPETIITQETPKSEITGENLEEESSIEKVNEAMRISREKASADKAFKKRIKDATDRFVKRFIDSASPIKSLMDKSGLSRVTDRLVTTKGASGRAKAKFKEIDDKIYSDLSKSENEALDDIIQVRRIKAIEENRKKRGLKPIKHPNNVTLEEANAWLTERAKDSDFEALNERADMYFDEFRSMLREAKKDGLVSQETLDQLIEVDYQPRKFIQYLIQDDVVDPQKVQKIANEYGLSESMIKSLNEGSADGLVTDSRWLLASAMNSLSRRRAFNEVNKTLAKELPKVLSRYNELKKKPNKSKAEIKELKNLEEINKNFKEAKPIRLADGTIKKTKEGKIMYPKKPKGFSTLHYYENGDQKRVYVSPEVYEQWYDTKQGIMSPKMRRFVATAFGSRLLKAMATGINPFFAITNFPRDFGHIIMSTDIYQKNVGMMIPAIANLTADFIGATRKMSGGMNNKTFSDFVEYGGMLDFMYLEGSFKNKVSIKNFVSPKAKIGAKKFFDFLTAANRYSEIGFRLAVFDKVSKEGMKEIDAKGLTGKEREQAIKDLKYSAARQAREIIDFSQAGYITRDLESALPYLNAATQGSRVAINYFRKNPVKAFGKTIEAAGILTGLTYVSSLALISALRGEDDEDKKVGEIFLETMEGVSPYVKRAYFVIPTGTKDDKGEWQYIRVAKTPQFIPFASLAEGSMQRWLASEMGRKPQDVDVIMDEVAEGFLNHSLPIDPRPSKSIKDALNRNPFAGGIIGYVTEYDLFRDRPLFYNRGKDIPEEKKGYYQKGMPEFYKAIADETGLSPAKMKFFVEKFITTPSTNPTVGMVYALANSTVSDESLSDNAKKSAEDLINSASKKVIGSTSQFNRDLRARENLEQELEKNRVGSIEQNQKIRDFAIEYGEQLFDTGDIPREVEEYIQSLPKEEQESAVNKFISYASYGDSAKKFFNIIYEPNEDNQAVLIKYEFGTSEREIEEGIMEIIRATKGKWKPSRKLMYKLFNETE